ncbi:MAG: DUF4258 domain-containing protein [Spirochaetes bacterium]|nr:DUF4258 domain-containing protein [Spirochaetota bacterium]
MLERRIESNDIIHALEDCSVIEKYQDDRPYPSCLLPGYSGGGLYILFCPVMQKWN